MSEALPCGRFAHRNPNERPSSAERWRSDPVRVRYPARWAPIEGPVPGAGQAACGVPVLISRSISLPGLLRRSARSAISV